MTSTAHGTIVAKAGPLLPAEHEDRDDGRDHDLRGESGDLDPDGRVVVAEFPQKMGTQSPSLQQSRWVLREQCMKCREDLEYAPLRSAGSCHRAYQLRNQWWHGQRVLSIQ